MSLHERATAALGKLPLTASAVADFLIDRGITGVPNECSACPISRWLRVELQIPVALVNIDQITLVDEKNIVHLDSTPGINAFISAFDLGQKYPELIDHNGLTEQEAFSVAYL